MPQLFGYMEQIGQVELRQRIERFAVIVRNRFFRFFRLAQKHAAYPVFALAFCRPEAAGFKYCAGAGDFLPQFLDFCANGGIFFNHFLILFVKPMEYMRISPMAGRGAGCFSGCLKFCLRRGWLLRMSAGIFAKYRLRHISPRCASRVPENISPVIHTLPRCRRFGLCPNPALAKVSGCLKPCLRSAGCFFRQPVAVTPPAFSAPATKTPARRQIPPPRSARPSCPAGARKRPARR